MAMSPQEFKALLATMDALLELSSMVKVKGNQEQINRVTEKFEHLKQMRDLAHK